MYSIGDRFMLKGPWIIEDTGEVATEDGILVSIVDPDSVVPISVMPLPENNYWVSNEDGSSSWMVTPNLLTPV